MQVKTRGCKHKVILDTLCYSSHMNKPYLSPHTRTELENTVNWLEVQCTKTVSALPEGRDVWERQSFMEGYTQAIWDLETLIRDAGKKDIDDIKLALEEQQERLENELE